MAEDEIRVYYKELEALVNSEEYQAEDSTILFRMQDTKRMRLFDVMGEDEYIGDAYVKRLLATAQKIRGRYEFGPMDIHADGNVAFVSYIQNFYGKKPDGGQYIMRCRTTDGLLKENGEWKMVHEHASLALNDETFLALRGRQHWDEAADVGR